MPLKFNPFTGEFDLVMSPGHGVATIQVDGDVGSAVPTAGGVLDILGGVGLSSDATVLNTLTMNLDVPVTVPNGGTGITSLVKGAFLVGNTVNALNPVGPLDDGEIFIGDVLGGYPVANTLTAGTGITITNAAGSITITSTTGFDWDEVTATTAVMQANHAYICNNNAAQINLTMPVASAIGDSIQVIGKGTMAWNILQNAGQTIHFISMDTTPGIGGSLSSTQRYDCVELVCITANTDWVVVDSEGNITIV